MPSSMLTRCLAQQSTVVTCNQVRTVDNPAPVVLRSMFFSSYSLFFFPMHMEPASRKRYWSAVAKFVRLCVGDVDVAVVYDSDDEFFDPEFLESCLNEQVGDVDDDE